MSGATLSELNLYPVKACRRTRLSVARVGTRGLEGDREWMVAREDGVFISQRTHPALAFVHRAFLFRRRARA